MLDVFVCQADPIATCSPSQSLSVSPMVKIHRESEQEEQRKLLIVSWGVGIWTTGYFPTGDFGERMLDEWSCEQVVMCVCVCVCVCVARSDVSAGSAAHRHILLHQHALITIMKPCAVVAKDVRQI